MYVHTQLYWYNQLRTDDSFVTHMYVGYRAQSACQGNQSWAKKLQISQDLVVNQCCQWKIPALVFTDHAFLASQSRFHRWHQQFWPLQSISLLPRITWPWYQQLQWNWRHRYLLSRNWTESPITPTKPSISNSPGSLWVKQFVVSWHPLIIFTIFPIIRQVRQMVSDGSGGTSKLGKKITF